MAEDKELVLPAGLEDKPVDPPDKLRLRPPVPLPNEIMPLPTNPIISYIAYNTNISSWKFLQRKHWPLEQHWQTSVCCIRVIK